MASSSSMASSRMAAVQQQRLRSLQPAAASGQSSKWCAPPVPLGRRGPLLARRQRLCRRARHAVRPEDEGKHSVSALELASLEADDQPSTSAPSRRSSKEVLLNIPLSSGSHSPLLDSTAPVDLTGAGNSVLKERIAELKAGEAAEADAKSVRKQEEKAVEKKVMSEVVAFAIPALGSVLADPLMSLVDTACVGLHSSLHLAALAPNTSVFNFYFQLFTFLGYTTTNLLATHSVKAALNAADREERETTSSRVLAHSLVLAVVCGLACTGTMLAFGPAMLKLMGASPETLGPALSYLSIRALASPAVMVANVAQGACLGQSDPWTPLRVFATSGLMNLILDYVLIMKCNMGITGAAIATTFAQVVAASYFLFYMHRQGKNGRMVPLGWHGLPSLKSLGPFWNVANTLLNRTMFTMLAYSSVSTIAAGMGVLQAAAHQVALQIFWFASYVPESLSVTAQSLIARDIKTLPKARMITHTLMKLGAAMGLGLATAICATLIGAPFVFSSDPMVHATLRSLALPASLAIVIATGCLTMDGISIGMGKFKHLATNNFAGLVACAGVLAAVKSCGLSLTTTWYALTLFFVLRQLGHLVVHGRTWDSSVFGNGQIQPAVVKAA